MTANYFLETIRLQLRGFTPDDSPFIIELLNSKGWIQFIGDRNIKTNEQAIHYLQNGPFKSYATHQFGLSLVQKRADETPVGMCGIIWRPELEHPDLGFALLPHFQGKGYAFEIANATLQYAKSTLHIETIAAITKSNNEQSIKLLEKLSFRFIRTFSFANSAEALLLYEK